jgi:hypothetical protein
MPTEHAERRITGECRVGRPNVPLPQRCDRFRSLTTESQAIASATIDHAGAGGWPEDTP